MLAAPTARECPPAVSHRGPPQAVWSEARANGQLVGRFLHAYAQLEFFMKEAAVLECERLDSKSEMQGCIRGQVPVRRKPLKQGAGPQGRILQDSLAEVPVKHGTEILLTDGIQAIIAAGPVPEKRCCTVSGKSIPSFPP
jgi:hypothetical protein